MKKNNLKRFLASLLAVLMLASVTGVSPAVFAAGNDAAAQSEESAEPVLRDGEAVIPKGSDAGTVKKILAKSLISNYDQLDPDSRDNLDWEFECVGWQKGDALHKLDSNTVFGDINGFESHKDKKIGLVTTTLDFQHEALASQADGSYKVRLKSNPNTVVFLSKVAKLSSNIVANDNVSVKLVYNDDGTINYDNINEAVFKAAVKSSDPELTFNDVTITYYAEATSGSLGSLGKEWMPLNGGEKKGLTYPGVAEGTTQVKIEYPENSTYYGKTIYVDINFLGREASAITFKADPVVKITYEEKDGNVQIKFDDLYAAIWNNVVESTVPELSLDDVTIKYYATAESGKIGDEGKDWLPLEGGQKSWRDTAIPLTYPAISEGDQELRFEFKGNANYTGFSKDITVKFEGRDPAFEIIPGVTQVDMKFKGATNYDYEATANAIREAVVKKLATDESINLSDVTVEYKDVLKFKTLDENADLTTGNEYTFRLSWGGSKGTVLYKPFSEEVKLTLVDNRLASEIKVVSGASITYNMSGSVEKDAIIANVIDYTNSTLPAGAEFTVEVPSIVDTSIVTIWKDITDNTMDAGENQKIRISFAGSAEYKPCNIVTTITVKKAPVSITLPIISKLYAGEEIKIDDYCTVTPKDPAIDVYLFFVGVNSNGEGCVNFQLTDDQMAIIDNLSKIQMKVFGVAENDTIKAKLRTGMKLSEFKETIEKLPDIDNIEFVNNILTILSTMDTITDNTIIAIGTPAHAGVYQATAVSFESKNYEAGKGTGSLVILKNWKNIKLEKNPVLNSGDKANTITVSQAEELKAGNNLCILTKDGEPLNSASAGSIHYWFTGVNRIHVGSKMPTAPGKYIVTASVRGGDFYAFPKTFTFTIVNDPAPEA